MEEQRNGEKVVSTRWLTENLDSLSHTPLRNNSEMTCIGLLLPGSH